MSMTCEQSQTIAVASVQKTIICFIAAAFELYTDEGNYDQLHSSAFAMFKSQVEKIWTECFPRKKN